MSLARHSRVSTTSLISRRRLLSFELLVTFNSSLIFLPGLCTESIQTNPNVLSYATSSWCFPLHFSEVQRGVFRFLEFKSTDPFTNYHGMRVKADRPNEELDHTQKSAITAFETYTSMSSLSSCSLLQIYVD